ncbi:PREDICTED: uncharacterized protein LOC108363917 [Rhagoletis zephyria]|uniref:uncharacterized protein LOC108363917 n=1 Tax=Rhagoletis zephyria TaxID=28612 RepID=UPI00081123FF|nr:PREDICTED: uncharacterized protein LOC108363917 [Rhagoletis zephyria]
MEIEYASKILANLKKSPNRTYTDEYIDKTLKDLLNVRQKIVKKEEEYEFDLLLGRIKLLLKHKVDEVKTKMSKFDLVTASKLIPEFQGDYLEVNNYLGLIEFYHDTLENEQQKQLLIKFVLATKLSEKVKNKILTEAKPTTFEDFKKLLKQTYKSYKTTSNIHSELSQTNQRGLNVNTFGSKIENLLASLNELQIKNAKLQKNKL